MRSAVRAGLICFGAFNSPHRNPCINVGLRNVNLPQSALRLFIFPALLPRRAVRFAVPCKTSTSWLAIRRVEGAMQREEITMTALEHERTAHGPCDLLRLKRPFPLESSSGHHSNQFVGPG